jgi:ketosteroid isomerase-like protein
MSQEIVERLRRAYAGERDPALLAPDFELHQSPSIIDTDGIFRGRTAFRDVQVELAESFEDMSWEPEQIIEAPGGEIVVLVRALGRGRGSGIEIDNHIAHVWSFRGHTSVRMVVYEEQAEALKAVGLDE